MSLFGSPSLWNIPYQRNPFFTGREDILSRLHRALHADQSVALSQPQGITGLGGIGKTQTVVEYAYRHREEYEAVLWVRADSVTALISSMIDLARLLDLPERNEQNQELIVQAVLRWLRVHSDWLLIYDNIDDLSLAEPFLPNAGAGHLLFTTRAHALGGLAQRLDIQQMDPEIGALLLLRRASLLAFQATLNMANPDEQRLAQAISQELDGLPLALDQAGAYIKETPCPLPDYLARYQTRRGDLLRVRGHFDQDYPASVATTWSLSFEKISQAHPAAPELLNFCAFLAPDAIPETLLMAGSTHLGAILAPVVANPLQFDQVCKEVLRFSLLQRGADEQTLTVHRLVQTVLRDNLSAKAQQQWMQRAVPAVDAALPTTAEFADWSTYERLVPHALICATWIEQVPLITLEAARLLHNTGFYLDERARYVEAEPLLQRSLAIYKQKLGARHPNTMSNLSNLAELYTKRGKYAEAEPLHQQTLAMRKRILGNMHLDTAISLNNLANLYQRQGKYAEAEPLLLQALNIYEQKSGARHPDTASCLSNLAHLYDTQGRYAEAEPLYLRTLAIREQTLGANHPATALNLNNLAACYTGQGKYAEAEPLYLRALAIREQTLGANHPDLAESLNNLALLYETLAKHAEAEPLYQRALAINEQLFGAHHPETARNLNNLAALYKRQEKYAEAEPLYLRALAIREQALGPMHAHTANSLNNLAVFYRDRGRYGEAEPLLQRALAICERTLGPMHPHTARCLENLGGVYKLQEKYKEAESFCLRALAICEQTLEPTHLQTADSLLNLASLYDSQKRYEEEEPLLLRVLAIYEQVFGTTHPETGHILKQLEKLCNNQGKYIDEALLLQRGRTILKQPMGIVHHNAMANLIPPDPAPDRGARRIDVAEHLPLPQTGVAAPSNAETEAKEPLTSNKYKLFRRDKLYASFFVLSFAEFSLLSGVGVLVGAFTQAWPWAVATVGVLFLLAYALGYRKVFSPATLSVIALASTVLVYGITLSLTSFHYDQMQTSHLWFNTVRILTLRHQILAGTYVGAVCSLFGFVIFTSSKQVSFGSLYLGNIVISIGGGIVGWLIVALLGSIFNWGFGFGYGWNFSLFGGFLVAALAGMGLICLLYVWSRARRA